jgi:quercetin dioxygenase-like cupin family protein
LPSAADREIRRTIIELSLRSRENTDEKTIVKKFDVAHMDAHEYDQGEKNVFYETPEFKMRVIYLAPGQSLPKCKMASHVVFICLKGEAEVSTGEKKTPLSTGQGLVIEPSTVSMKTDTGARLLGIQIAKAKSVTEQEG